MVPRAARQQDRASDREKKQAPGFPAGDPGISRR